MGTLSYSRVFGATPQTSPVFGREDQVVNNAGGYVFKLDPFKVLDRFLILGSEGNTYYCSEQKMVMANAKNVLSCVKMDGCRVVDRIVEISGYGRAPKNDPALFALAICASFGDSETKSYALDRLPAVARIGTHLFHFAEYVNSMRGWGPALRRAVGDWYLKKTPKDLAFQVAKYQQRDGWGNKDLLKLAHPKPSCPEINDIFRWVTTESTDGLCFGRGYDIILAMEMLKDTDIDETAVTNLILNYGLTMEMIPTQFRGAKIWEALLPKMGLTALIRNLGNMSKSGFLAAGQRDAINTVCAKITDADGLKKARIHPIAILAAVTTYSQGCGMRGKGTWEPARKVVDALDRAFILSFGNVQSSGKRVMLGIDISGSMGAGEIAGIPGLTPRIGAAAMAMITARSEENVECMAFTSKFCPFPIGSQESLREIITRMERMNYGATNCSLPMLYALEKRILVDAFIVYTDNETWCGGMQPFEALRKYRKQTGINAKLIVVGMTATEFTIADPRDQGMLDVVGFDASAPEIMRQFIVGEC